VRCVDFCGVLRFGRDLKPTSVIATATCLSSLGLLCMFLCIISNSSNNYMTTCKAVMLWESLQWRLTTFIHASAVHVSVLEYNIYVKAHKLLQILKRQYAAGNSCPLLCLFYN